MKRLGLFLLATVLLAGLAFAASPTVQRDRWAFLGGLSIGIDSAANRVTRTLGGSLTHDFTSQTITCADSPSITVTGAVVGDPCFVGSAVAPGNANFTCYVSATNTVLVHFCPAGTAVDPASQLFRVRVVSNQ